MMATRALTADVPSGTTLQFVNYTVTGYPVPTIQFQWERDGVPIAGATDSTYKLTDLDIGKEITVGITVTNIFGSRRKVGGITGGFGITSSPSAPSFLGTPSASIVGATVGDLVTIENTGVTGFPEPTVTFEWTLNGSTIDGESGASYTTTTIGDLIGFISATNTVGTTSASVDFGTIQAFTSFPSFLGTPSASVFGTTVGQVVEILNRGVTGFPEPSVSYDWYLNESIISGANGYTYSPEEVGELTASIIATNSVGTTSADIDFGTVISAGETYKSFETFNTELQAIIDAGGTSMDAQNQIYAYDSSSVTEPNYIILRGDGSSANGAIPIDSSFEIKNARFRGGRPQTWTNIGDGIFKVSGSNLPALMRTSAADQTEISTAGRTSECRVTFFDYGASTHPNPAIYPAVSTDLNNLRYTNGDAWLNVYSNGNTGDFESYQTNGSATTNSTNIKKIVVSGSTKTSLDTLISGVGSTGLGILGYASSNVSSTYLESYTNSGTTAELVFQDGFDISSYFTFAILGGARSTASGLSAGEFSVDFSNGDVYYRPVNGDPSLAGWGETQRTMTLVKGRAKFTNCEFSDVNGPLLTQQTSTDNAAIALGISTVSVSAGTTYGVTLDNCTLSRGQVLLGTGRHGILNSTFNESVYMGCIASEGSYIDSTIFKSSQMAECLRLIRVSPALSTPIEHSTITNCWFNNTAAHGQPISLYQSSANNATVTNNVFYNSIRGIAMKIGQNWSSIGGTLEIANNFVYIDSIPIEGIASEGAIQDNGGSDSILTTPQKIRVQNNTCISKFGSTTVLENGSGKYGSIGFRYHGEDGNGNLSDWVTGYNVAPKLFGFDDTNGTTWSDDGSEHYYNMFLEDRDFVNPETSYYTFGAGPTPLDVNQGSFFNYETNGLSGEHLPDTLGIQWDVIPTPAQVNNPSFCIGITKDAINSLPNLDSVSSSPSKLATKWTTFAETGSVSGSDVTFTDGVVGVTNDNGKFKGILSLGTADSSYITNNDPVFRLQLSNGMEIPFGESTQTDSSTITFTTPFNFVDSAISNGYLVHRDCFIPEDQRSLQPVQQTISQTIGDTTFSWTLTGVGQTGEFVDGSIWVTPVEGQDLKLISTTPSPGITHYAYDSAGLTLYYDGVAINEPIGNEFSSLSDVVSYSIDNDTLGLTQSYRTSDNRHAFVFVSGAAIQNEIDQYFDIDTFTERKSLLDSGSGITLNAHDSVVLHKSYLDPTDNTVLGNWTQGIPFTGSRERSPIKNAAVLSILPSAPAETCFRPPIQWKDSDRANRPMPALSSLDTTLVGVTQSPLVHSADQAVNWNNEFGSPDISERMVPPFLWVGAVGAYAASWAVDQIAKGKKINGYGGNVIPEYNSLLNEIYRSTSSYTEEERTQALYRMLQYGIDSFGVLSRLARTSSGAGQQPAVHQPWQQFTHAAFGNTFGIESVLETYVNGYSGLSETQKALTKINFYHEDTTIRVLTTGVTNDVTHFALYEAGGRLGGTLDTSKFVAAVTADASTVTDASGQTDLTFSSTVGFGRLDFSSTPYRWEGSVSASPKGLNHWDLIGTNLHINVSGTTYEYQVIFGSTNAGKYEVNGEDLTNGPCSIWVDRPFDVTPDENSTYTSYPFVAEDDGGYFYFKEGSGYTLDPSRDVGPSLWSTGYGEVSAKAWLPPYMALRHLYSTSGISTDNIGVLDGWIKTFVESGTQRRLIWQLKNSGRVGVGAYEAPAAWDPAFWLSHSGVTSEDSYLLGGQTIRATADNEPYYAAEFEITDSAVSNTQLKLNGYYEEYNTPGKFDFAQYEPRGININSDLGKVDFWFRRSDNTPPWESGSFSSGDAVEAFFESTGYTLEFRVNDKTYAGFTTEAGNISDVCIVTALYGASADELIAGLTAEIASGNTVGVAIYPYGYVPPTLNFEIQGLTLDYLYPVLGETDLVELSFSVAGGSPPYLIDRNWYLNGVTVGGNSNFFNITGYTYGDEFYVQVSVEDEAGLTLLEQSPTGTIIQPISFESISISPSPVGYTGEISISINGLTGTEPIAKQYTIVSGITTSGPQSGNTFDLEPLGLTAGLTLTGSVIMTNNGGSTSGQVTINIIDPNAPSDYDTYAIGISTVVSLSTSNTSFASGMETSPTPSTFVDDMSSARIIDSTFAAGSKIRVSADTSAGSDASYGSAVPYLAMWCYPEQVWYVGPYISGSYQESIDNGLIVDGSVEYDMRTGTADTKQTGITAAYGVYTRSQPNDFRLFLLSQYTEGDVADWTPYEEP